MWRVLTGVWAPPEVKVCLYLGRHGERYSTSESSSSWVPSKMPTTAAAVVMAAAAAAVALLLMRLVLRVEGCTFAAALAFAVALVTAVLG